MIEQQRKQNGRQNDSEPSRKTTVFIFVAALLAAALLIALY